MFQKTYIDELVTRHMTEPDNPKK